MKLTSVLAGPAIAALALFSDAGAMVGLPKIAQAEAAVSVSFNVFYDRLANDGDWVRYGDDYVFIPGNVKRGWKPYTQGHWVYADEVGWTWASDESFGWATYHYGRWGYADDIGWYWVPGTRWAPAWVSWKRTPEYVVWAPLPPRGRSNDVSVTISASDVPDFYWVAVPTRRFLEPNLRIAIIDSDAERRRIVQRAEVIGTVRIENNIVVNNVINVDVIERESGRKVRRVKIRDTNDPTEARASADQVTVFQGEVKAEADAKPKRLRDVKEARKIRREDDGTNSADTEKMNQPDDATGTTTRQESSERPADTSAPADDATGGKASTKRERTRQTDEAAPSDVSEGKRKQEERQRNKATGQRDQPTSKNKGNGADVTRPADNQNGKGADVTAPDPAQSGKAKADSNRQKARQNQNAAPEDPGQGAAQKAQRNRQQQPDEQGGAQPQQRKKGKQQKCDPSDPSCAQ